ncbi:thymidine kinase [Pseudoalteromonas ulvae UL12]|uniref:thymidine kinase n=1 Tax=Pseudoalteromonas ulvae TaxID=107327 RepID=UPI00186BB00F|nr:thymidine kinase [Pseudoalteromonas ulvae]MBE0365817.1 thymidine kinase [Pseudoalteromonas ulvae UL12]
MAQLYFYYSAMNAGKSTTLLQSSFNYQERGMNPLIFTAAIDTRYGQGQVSSRIGLSAKAELFAPESDIYLDIQSLHQSKKVDCVLIDESQFLTKKQVNQLTDVVDKLNIPVLCYGLRTDFRGELFVGAQYLLAWADKLIELKTVCHCGRKANMVLRTDEQGVAIADGEQVEIGGNERYVSVCRKHYKKALETLEAVIS